ncbi:MAG: metallophosphoesterase [Clostridia bacterium]|nr:metallophosphoesterase [Clostridia bacterium]
MIKPTISPSPSPTPAPTPFSVVWMSDTQGYAGSLHEVLESMFDWTASVSESENLVALLHTGDIVQDMTKAAQWENVRACDARLPDTLLRVTAAGNHDIGPKGDEPENFLRYRIDTQLDPAAEYAGGLCRYTTLEAGGVKLLILSIAYLHEAESAAWAREVLAAHPEHFAILLAHSYLAQSPHSQYDGYTSSGVILRDQIVLEAPNLRMVLCGHVHGSASLPLDAGEGAEARRVHQFLLNYQASDRLRAGFLRLIRFDPMADSIEIVTYSPYRDAFADYRDPLGASLLIEQAGLAAFAAP